MIKIEISKTAAEWLMQGLKQAEEEERQKACFAFHNWEKRDAREKADIFKEIREVVLEATRHEYFPKA